jgi:uncharacterized protein (DUF302 family)
MFKQTLFLLILFTGCLVNASEELETIFSINVEKPGEEVYQSVYKSLEESRFYVIFEANIGKNLARNAKRWGDEYNKNNFEMVKAMVVCNPYYANQVMNLDPKLMALCPMTITVMHKAGKSTVLFNRLMPAAEGSAAEDILWEVENTIVAAIEHAVEQ